MKYISYIPETGIELFVCASEVRLNKIKDDYALSFFPHIEQTVVPLTKYEFEDLKIFLIDKHPIDNVFKLEKSSLTIV